MPDFAVRAPASYFAGPRPLGASTGPPNKKEARFREPLFSLALQALPKRRRQNVKGFGDEVIDYLKLPQNR
ncbi:MAG TPA: hypothetical protein VGH62_06990 [Bradyrhizobium sp.]